jgi:hypothetical protein
MLSEPQPSESILGRPYRIGICGLEAHRCIPSAEVQLTENLQSEANDIVNQRLDNVKLVLNKGYFVKRNMNVDLRSLKRSYPGRIVMTDEINDAIKTDETNDVTGSSYQEQDRINADIDDMTGGMSTGTVMTNRKLGETVGGMNLMNQAGNTIGNYSIRTFVETWVEPVLSDVLLLIQAYESDETIAKFAQSIGVEPDRNALTQPLKASVSVGYGPLDPKVKVQALIQGIQAVGAVAPWAMGGLDVKMLSTELFGSMGYRDGSKFFPQVPDGPPEPQPDPMVELKKQELVMDRQIEMAKLQINREVKLMELALKEGLTKEQLYAKLDLEMDKLNLNILQEMGRRDETQRDREEMALKQRMGEGI